MNRKFKEDNVPVRQLGVNLVFKCCLIVVRIEVVSTMSLVRAVSLEPAPTPQEDLSDSEDDRDEDGIDDCDRVSSEDSGTDDSSDEDEDEDQEGKPRRPDLFPDPLSLIDHAADLNSVLRAKSIGDAIQILCPNLPGISAYSISLQHASTIIFNLLEILETLRRNGYIYDLYFSTNSILMIYPLLHFTTGLPSKARGKYQKRKLLTEEQKAKILRARNRDNARRTRKRKKLYVNFIDKALKALEAALGVSSSFSSASSSSKLDEERDKSDVENEDRESKIKSENCNDQCEDMMQCSTGVSDEMNEDMYTTNTCCMTESSSSTNYQGQKIKGPTFSNETAQQSTKSQIVEPCKCDSVSKLASDFAGMQSALLAKRLRYVKGYLKLRHTPVPAMRDLNEKDWSSVVSEWLNVCSAEMVHVTPLPAYRTAQDFTDNCTSPLDCTYECRGVNAVAMDATRIAHYFDNLEMGACCTYRGHQDTMCDDDEGHEERQRVCKESAGSRGQIRHWHASYAMDTNTATLSKSGETLHVSYVLTVQLGDKPVNICSGPSVFGFPAVVERSCIGSDSGSECVVVQRMGGNGSGSVCGENINTVTPEEIPHTDHTAHGLISDLNLNGSAVFRALHSLGQDQRQGQSQCQGQGQGQVVGQGQGQGWSLSQAYESNSIGIRGSLPQHTDTDINHESKERIESSSKIVESEDDDIMSWIQIALDTTHMRDTRQKRHFAEKARRKKGICRDRKSVV